MKQFIIKILLFILPAIFIIVLVIYIDFFKIFGFQNYYLKQRISLNREMITTSTFNHYRVKEKFNSFIFGSSRSQAYKCKDWICYLDQNAKTFHFDASNEGVWGISKKIEYIDKIGDTIKNALIVVDRTLLQNTQARDGHLFVSMPCVSGLSKFEYYYTFIEASLNPKFIIANIDYSLFKTYRGYMGYLLRRSKYDQHVNNVNCDLWYGSDREIEADSIGYYKRLIEKGIFYKRPRINLSECIVTPDEKEQLSTIKSVFKKHCTKI